jgi:hypothetical protein
MKHAKGDRNLKLFEPFKHYRLKLVSQVGSCAACPSTHEYRKAWMLIWRSYTGTANRQQMLLEHSIVNTVTTSVWPELHTYFMSHLSAVCSIYACNCIVCDLSFSMLNYLMRTLSCEYVKWSTCRHSMARPPVASEEDGRMCICWKSSREQTTGGGGGPLVLQVWDWTWDCNFHPKNQRVTKCNVGLRVAFYE